MWDDILELVVDIADVVLEFLMARGKKSKEKQNKNKKQEETTDVN